MDNMDRESYENGNVFEERVPYESFMPYEPSGYTAPVQPVKAAKEKNGRLKLAALAVSFSMLGGALGTGGTLAALRYFGSSGSSGKAASSESREGGKGADNSTAVIKTAEPSGDRAVAMQTVKSSDTAMTAAEVYQANVDSTVGITTEITTNYFGYKTTAAASGSGFIVTEDGYIVTNYHVIEGASSVKVTTYDNTSYDAEIVGSDESNDIAVLKIEADGLAPVTLGDSEALNVGDDVIAIGNPLGELTFTLTSGVVSAKDRQITTSNSVMMNLIQTDCAINAGNSGGALFNMYGEVVGVTNAKYSSNSSSEASIDNIGFAIPINTVQDIVTSIIENGYVVKPYIGVSVETVSSDMQSYGIPAGAVVRVVSEDSPAEAAGLRENDIITKVNDTEITSSNDLVALVRKTAKGDALTLSVYRQGSELNVTLTVDETKQDSRQPAEEDPEDGYGYDYGDDREFDFGGIDPFDFFGMW